MKPLRSVNAVNGGHLKIENISKNFGTFKVLDNINLEIKPGEFFSLLGPSGCGKTTLLRIIAGFETPSVGGLFLDNNDITYLPSNKRHVNTVFQSYALFPHLSVFENVAFPLRLKKEKESIIKEKVGKYLDLVQLNAHAKKYPAQLSGGQKQRVAIARALINEPSILLLDEPLSALDAKLRHKLLIELDSIHDKTGITFIFVTHDQQEALSVSDRIAVMKDGVVLQVGSPSEIYETPADMFVANFIGETNVFVGTVKEVLGDQAILTVDGIGEIKICTEKDIKKDDRLKCTIRPEKIRITSSLPDTKSEEINVLNGKVDELIYTGFQSRYYVKINNFIFKIFKQHVKYFMDETPIKWKDDVYVWWYVDDEFIVEVN